MNDFVNLINDFEVLLKQNKGLIDMIGDCPNIERPIAPKTVFWEKIAEKNGYECQENYIFGKCRIVSPHKTRVANGSKNAMLHKLDRFASSEFFRKGDIVGVSRNGLYEHYGIYTGNGRVIHYAGEDNDLFGKVTVHEVSFSEFIKDSSQCFVVWFDNGRPVKLQQSYAFLFGIGNDPENWHSKKRYSVFSADVTIQRARSRLGEERYDLVKNNCEHFAMWCKTGVAESSQVKQLLRVVANNRTPKLVSLM